MKLFQRETTILIQEDTEDIIQEGTEDIIQEDTEDIIQEDIEIVVMSASSNGTNYFLSSTLFSWFLIYYHYYKIKSIF